MGRGYSTLDCPESFCSSTSLLKHGAFFLGQLTSSHLGQPNPFLPPAGTSCVSCPRWASLYLPLAYATLAFVLCLVTFHPTHSRPLQTGKKTLSLGRCHLFSQTAFNGRSLSLDDAPLSLSWQRPDTALHLMVDAAGHSQYSNVQSNSFRIATSIPKLSMCRSDNFLH